MRSFYIPKMGEPFLPWEKSLLKPIKVRSLGVKLVLASSWILAAPL
jgi:hypothetical protein